MHLPEALSVVYRVAAYEGPAFGVADFEGEKKEEGFDAVEPAIHKVA